MDIIYCNTIRKCLLIVAGIRGRPPHISTAGALYMATAEHGAGRLEQACAYTILVTSAWHAPKYVRLRYTSRQQHTSIIAPPG